MPGRNAAHGGLAIAQQVGIGNLSQFYSHGFAVMKAGQNGGLLLCLNGKSDLRFTPSELPA
jgi:hypothetical protein